MERGVEEVKSEPGDDDDGVSKAAKTDLKQTVTAAEKLMKTTITQLQQVTLQAHEIMGAVDTDEAWQWIGKLPQFDTFSKNYKKLTTAKESSRVVKTLLLNRCDFGHLLFLLSPTSP